MSAECTSFIIDVSEHMIQTGMVYKIIPYLEYALFDKCKRSRKTDWIECCLANYSKTQNSMELENIYQIQEFVSSISTDDVIKIVQTLTNVKKSDGIDTESLNTIEQCLLLSTLNIKDNFNKRKMMRQIVCFTDDLMSITLTDEEIDSMLEEYTGRFLLIDCRSPDQIKKDKDNNIQENSRWLKLISKCPGSLFLTMDDLLVDIMSPKAPIVKPVRIFSGQLRLGADVDNILNDTIDNQLKNMNDEFSLCINVEGYPATKPVFGMKRKQVFMNEKDEHIAPKSIIEYTIHKKNIVNGVETIDMVPVSVKSVTKAYRYGSDYVVLPTVLADELYYKAPPGIDIRGFMGRLSLPRQYLNSESAFIFADTRLGSLGDIATFSSLVDVMLDNDKVAICRYVQKINADIQMCVLVPIKISTKNLQRVRDFTTFQGDYIRALIINRLPFAEDERLSVFPSLSNRKTTSSKPLSSDEEKEKEKEKETDNLMSDFIDSLDTDKLPDTPKELYYQNFDETVKNTVLPLPDPIHDDPLIKYAGDPLRMLAIAPHRQQQVLIEYIHQMIIEGNSEFYPPDLLDINKEKISPHIRGAVNINKLVSLLEIKEVAKEAKAEVKDNTGRLQKIDYNSTQNAPPLEDLLVLGRRE